MKRWIIIALLLFAAVKPPAKPAPKPYIPPKVPPIILYSFDDSLDINMAMIDIYKYMQKNEKEKKQLGYEISNLQLELDKLESQISNLRSQI